MPARLPVISLGSSADMEACREALVHTNPDEASVIIDELEVFAWRARRAERRGAPESQGVYYTVTPDETALVISSLRQHLASIPPERQARSATAQVFRRIIPAPQAA